MNGEHTEWEPAQLRGFRAGFAASLALCELALAALGEPASESERVLIHPDTASVDRAIARALALAARKVAAP